MSFNAKKSTEDLHDELETLGWYHFDLSRHAAEALLLSNGMEGTYLLRNSHKGPGCFALSVKAKDSVKHFNVMRKNGSFSFGFNEFASLQELVSHFANQPLLGSDTGTLIVLKCPYPWHVEEPSIYESVRVHTAMQTGGTVNDLVANAPSFGTKEGYLVKQGGIVKDKGPPILEGAVKEYLNPIKHLWIDLKMAVQKGCPYNLMKLETICKEEC